MFNQKEQRGIAVLLTIYFLLVFATLFMPSFLPAKQFDFKGFEKEVDAFEKNLARLDSQEILEKRKKFEKFKKGNIPVFADTVGKLHSEPLLIELNAADTFELQQLRGIGSSFAKRIVAYRERLGGFHDKVQLQEVWGMDTARYNKIAEHLTVNPDSVHRINLNSATFKELLRHPYFPFEISKAIILYRKEHKKFSNFKELRLVPGLHDSVYRKIIPYLQVEKE